MAADMDARAPQKLRFGEFELDEGNALLTRAGRSISLPPKAFSVLCVLARQPGQLTRKDALLDAVWGHRHVSESVLKTTISQVRAALADDAAAPRYIETVSRHGYRFIGAPEASAGVPAAVPTALPPADAAPAEGFPMIGRQAALAHLHAAWKSALSGGRKLVWVVGDPGIGKTTLIDTFVREAQPIVVARGQCVEQHGAGEPYRPVLEALGSLCRQFPELPALMRAVAPTWLVQFPWLSSVAEREALQRELTGITQERMLREVVELVERFTPEHPFLFITEDLHWSDQATLRLIDHYARRRGPLRLLWLASFRLSQALAEEHALVPLRQELRLHRLCDELALESFSEREVADYTASRLPAADIPERFVQQLHAHTDGLPLFVANVIDTLLAQGAAEGPDAQRWLDDAGNAPLPIPEDLTGAIERQISRLPPDTRAVLEAASVCGMEFSPNLLASLVEQEPATLRACCDELARRQYWLREAELAELPDGTLETRIVFRHALIRHVFYQRLSTGQRAQLHRRLARLIEQGRAHGLEATAAELASHFELGHEPLSALKYFAQAAAAAMARFAPPEAAELTEKALRVLDRCPQGPQRLELELALVSQRALAHSQLEGIGSARATEAFARVRAICAELPVTPQRALLLGSVGWVIYMRGDFDDAKLLARQVLDIGVASGSAPAVICACNLMALTLGTQGRHVEACEWCERGIAACVELGDALPSAAFLIDPEASMRTVMAIPLACRGLFDQARAQAERAIARAMHCGQPFAKTLAHKCAMQMELRMGHLERVAELYVTFERTATTLMVRQAAGPILWFKGLLEAHAGNALAGHGHIRAGYAIHERLGMHASCTEVLAYAAEAKILEGDWDAAQQDLDEAIALATRLGEWLYGPEMHLLQAKICRGRNDPAAARGALEKARVAAREQQAFAWELKALMELIRLDGRREDLEALAACLGQITEGRDLKLVRDAQALLASGKI